MKLIDRLKPRYKEAINVELEKYPFITQLIIDELESNEYVTSITYGTYLSLKAFIEMDSVFDLFEEL